MFGTDASVALKVFGLPTTYCYRAFSKTNSFSDPFPEDSIFFWDNLKSLNRPFQSHIEWIHCDHCDHCDYPAGIERDSLPKLFGPKLLIRNFRTKSLQCLPTG